MATKYTFKIYPVGRSKEIYRIIEISGNSTLDDLCDAILEAFDFTHEHLYEFCLNNKPYCDYCMQYLTEDDMTETNVKIDKLNLDKGQNFLFHYDFGDDWMFTVHVNKIEEVSGRIKTTQIGEKGKLEQYPDWDDEECEF